MGLIGCVVVVVDDDDLGFVSLSLSLFVCFLHRVKGHVVVQDRLR